MNDIFDLCVQILLGLAALFGTTYKAINVWIFVIIWPLFTVFLIGMVVFQRRKIREMEKRFASISGNNQDEDI